MESREGYIPINKRQFDCFLYTFDKLMEKCINNIINENRYIKSL